MNQFKPSLQSVTNPDGAAILDIDRGTITTLNTTGSFVWQQLCEGQTMDTITSALAKQTGQDTAQIHGDLRDFVEDLRGHRLLSQ